MRIQLNTTVSAHFAQVYLGGGQTPNNNNVIIKGLPKDLVRRTIWFGFGDGNASTQFLQGRLQFKLAGLIQFEVPIAIGMGTTYSGIGTFSDSVNSPYLSDGIPPADSMYAALGTSVVAIIPFYVRVVMDEVSLKSEVVNVSGATRTFLAVRSEMPIV